MKAWLFLTLCAAAALVPLASRPANPPRPLTPPWPETYDGAPLRPLHLTAVEEKFYAAFPGSAARFTDGRRELIFRWITSGTRQMHPVSDCFRGLGYTTVPEQPELDTQGRRWNRFTASRGATRLRVRERIATADESQSWTDVSAWYWSTLLHSSTGPWLATTVAEVVE